MNADYSLMFPSPDAAAVVDGGEDGFCLNQTVVEDADDHAAGLQHWQQEYEQLSGGTFSGSLDEVWFGNIQLFRERSNQVLHQTGRAWDGSRSIGVVLDADGDGLLSGTMLKKDSLVTLQGGEALDFRTPKHLDLIAVSTGAHEFQEFAHNLWNIDTEAILATPGALHHPVESARRLGVFLVDLLNDIKSRPQMLNYPQIRKVLEQEIFNNLAEAISDAGPCRQVGIATSRKCVVEKAKAYVLEHHDDLVTVSDLCTALNISRRTLQYSFETMLDISPVAYLRAIRLNRVRRALKANAGCPDITVADIAAHWGFWHLSRFASNYKQIFGELPSETLRKHH